MIIYNERLKALVDEAIEMGLQQYVRETPMSVVCTDCGKRREGSAEFHEGAIEIHTRACLCDETQKICKKEKESATTLTVCCPICDVEVDGIIKHDGTFSFHRPLCEHQRGNDE